MKTGTLNTVLYRNGSVDLRKVKTAVLVGFVGGAVFASPLGIQGQRIAGGIIGGVPYLMGQIAIVVTCLKSLIYRRIVNI